MSTDPILQNESSQEESSSTSTTIKVSKESPVKNKKDEKISIRNLLFFILVIFIVVFSLRVFVAKPFIVSGTSMYPTFNTWDYLIVDQLTYRFSSPQRGDVIVFRYPRDPSKFFIKRIIGLPYETLKLAGTKVTIFNATHKNGFTLNEPYVAPKNQKNNSMTVTLTKGQYFVMGDNRRVSYDSRYWGPVPYKNIIGRVYVRLFPFTEIGLHPGAATYTINNSATSK